MLLNTIFNQRAIVKGCMNKEIAIKSTNEFNHFSYRQCICASTCVSINLSVCLSCEYVNDDTCMCRNKYIFIKYIFIVKC